MKASIITLAAVAGIASAQFSGVPQCAQACLTSAISSVGCAITDVGCQCSSTAQIQGFGAGCILGACTAPGELASAIAGGGALCSNYLATVSAEPTTTIKSTVTETSTVTAQTTSIASVTKHNTTSEAVKPTGGVTSKPSSTPTQVPVNGGSTLQFGLGGAGAMFVGLLAFAL